MLTQMISLLFQVYMIMLFVRILGSWVPEFQTTKPMLFVAYYTDPYLNLFRRVIPPLGFIDISPIFAFLALQLLRGFFLSLAL
ncbi:putative membrane protein YlmG [Chlamydiales bacterium STE3]|nr:putative membrane protein YlmG [Chlamydiales bacterium STE3]